jgi:hypothetical protein
MIVLVLSSTATHPQGVPDYADAKAQDKNVVVEVGQPVERRESRQVSLCSSPSAR